MMRDQKKRIFRVFEISAYSKLKRVEKKKNSGFVVVAKDAGIPAGSSSGWVILRRWFSWRS